eukprot:365532-Chlamydomonas_euryale.AAC.3
MPTGITDNAFDRHVLTMLTAASNNECPPCRVCAAAAAAVQGRAAGLRQGRGPGSSGGQCGAAAVAPALPVHSPMWSCSLPASVQANSEALCARMACADGQCRAAAVAPALPVCSPMPNEPQSPCQCGSQCPMSCTARRPVDLPG